MKIVIDAMGGDNAPLATLQGAAQAVREYGVQVVAVGDREKMAKVIREQNIDVTGIELVHAADVIGMDEEPAEAVRKKPEASVSVGLRMLAAGEADALVSAGSTGALLVGGTLIAKRIKGVKRAAIGTVMPGQQKPWLLIDCGANAECRPEMLVQFAIMGTAYQEKVMGVENPTVALANNGAEETKGTALQLAAYPLLQASTVNFTGNIEARDIPTGAADVVVCDGFTGNIILKLVEGVAKMFSAQIKQMFYANLKTKLAGLALKGELAAFKKSFDYSEYGGAPLLGLRKPVIKAHGSSDAKAIKNAIRQAATCAEKDVAGSIEEWIKANGGQGAEDDA